ncbi:helix-turn-helix domain-containing protein [Siminovitchia sediminis]|uniref:Helix-turn-helix domain-containing protein n=1 Tax=Siminovitchia sediminis TaxID=1274353 RepID=A0ABW4KGG6_9BACI
MIQDLYKKGWSITDIAEEMGVSWPTAKKYTKEFPRNKRGRTERANWTRIKTT